MPGRWAGRRPGRMSHAEMHRARSILEDLGLSPYTLARRQRPAAFVDAVKAGMAARHETPHLWRRAGHRTADEHVLHRSATVLAPTPYGAQAALRMAASRAAWASARRMVTTGLSSNACSPRSTRSRMTSLGVVPRRSASAAMRSSTSLGASRAIDPRLSRSSGTLVPTPKFLWVASRCVGVQRVGRPEACVAGSVGRLKRSSGLADRGSLACSLIRRRP